MPKTVPAIKQEGEMDSFFSPSDLDLQTGTSTVATVCNLIITQTMSRSFDHLHNAHSAKVPEVPPSAAWVALAATAGTPWSISANVAAAL